jgi:hypothetical protein
MKKFAMFAFNGDPMCFIHVLINALDLKEKGHDVALVIEGSSVRLTSLLSDGAGLEEFKAAKPEMYKMISGAFAQVKDAGLISCVCRACATQLGAVEAVEAAGLPFCAELKGHPSMARYIAEGYEILTF